MPGKAETRLKIAKAAGRKGKILIIGFDVRLTDIVTGNAA